MRANEAPAKPPRVKKEGPRRFWVLGVMPLWILTKDFTIRGVWVRSSKIHEKLPRSHQNDYMKPA